MKTIYVIEQILAVLFITCYAYQLFYLAYMLVKKPARAPMASRKHVSVWLYAPATRKML